jgi:hypothetical protein
MGPPPLRGKESAAARFDLCSGRMLVIVMIARGYSKENLPKSFRRFLDADDVSRALIVSTVRRSLCAFAACVVTVI